MGIFDGMLICTDLDGTLFKSDKTISDENIKAIEYFKSEGGFFTFITGRMPFFVSYVIEKTKPNAPFGCINGGGLYDSVKGEYVCKTEMPGKVMDMVEYVDKNLPGIGIQVNTFDNIYFSKENETMKIFREITGAKNIVRGYRDISETLAKIVFGNEEDAEILNLAKALFEHPLAGEFDFIRSEKTLYEILPKGVGKGTAVKNLCNYLGIDKRCAIAVGDYDNDISMFKEAGLGIAVENACQKAKDAAKCICAGCNDNAIADVIFGVESGKYAL